MQQAKINSTCHIYVGRMKMQDTSGIPGRSKYQYIAYLMQNACQFKSWETKPEPVARLDNLSPEYKQFLGTQNKFIIFKKVYALLDGNAYDRNSHRHGRFNDEKVEHQIMQVIFQDIHNSFGIPAEKIIPFDNKPTRPFGAPLPESPMG